MDGKTEIERFDSPEAFVNRLIKAEAKWRWMTSEDWDTLDITTVTQAMRVALGEGWPEQARKMRTLEESIFAQLSYGATRIDPSYSEEPGQAIDIAAYAAGEPEHWIHFDESAMEGSSNRILRVCINIGARGSVDKSTIVARGTMAASLIEALEYRGHRCEVIVCKATQGKDRRHAWYMQIKSADQPLNLSRLLFWVAHPAVMRRLHFALLGSTKAPSAYEATHRGGFGYSIDIDDKASFDIYVPAAFDDTTPINWCDNDKAQAWLAYQIKNLERNN